ncbi:Beta-1,2-xylosyltransferase 1 [Fusarium odoratissimum]|uniref:Beta-1,2-xylosyltransferase 1 n=1 Tax=Fusarium oxysporum f. sp. cubense (strain race 4) TaxID=2502994 RepID=N1REN3_FUSC4|nr:Beta-1,2-xylosyltransferase 1 [Fusarium odoratissimum]
MTGQPSTTPGSAPQDEDLVQGSAEPRKVPTPGMHPIGYLARNAQEEFGIIKARQSKTLEEAIQEYRRRYGIPPPPLFDEWFRFAKDNDVKLIDEFDTIHDLITPFWGLKPKTIRARAREALGFDTDLSTMAGFYSRLATVPRYASPLQHWAAEPSRSIVEGTLLAHEPWKG